jgi:hypothetical protein
MYMCINVYKNQQSRQTGTRNLMGPKTLPFVSSVFNFGHFWFPMCLIFLSVNSERKWKCSHFNQRYYVFTVGMWLKMGIYKMYMCINVYKNQQSRQTGTRNLMGPKTLPTIWGTCGKRFWTHHIPSSCLPTLLIFIHIYTHIHFVYALYKCRYRWVQKR